MSVTTYSLQMLDPAALKPAPQQPALEVRECVLPQFQFNRYLYTLIGAQWQWNDKLSWTDAQWRAWVESPMLRTWVGYCQGTPAGYFELHKQAGEAVEIAYFGLVAEFIGKGFGGDLLSQSIARAWEWGARRVWVHTCSLDHPSALANYQARGLRIYQQETT